MRITRLGKRHPSEPVVKSSTPYGDPVYWIGPVGRVSDSAPDTDCGAIEQHAVSLTTLRFALTHHVQLSQVRDGAGPLGGSRYLLFPLPSAPTTASACPASE